jgi:Peptidase A4 family
MRSKFFAVVAAAVALVALAEPAASAARSTSAGSEKAAGCPGGTSLTAVSAHRLPAGAMAYTYKLLDGTSFESIAPPAGFNPATAGSALLTELNLPQRPKGAVARRSWDAQVAPVSKSKISGATQFCENKSIAEPKSVTAPQPAVGAVPAATAGGTKSFSGYEWRSGSYEKAVTRFTQPHVSGAGSFSDWVGLNGTADGTADRLVQAGADTLGRPFWELYCSGGSSDGCNSAQIDGKNLAAPGDTVSVSVSFNPVTRLSYYAVSINGAQVVNVEYLMIKGSHSGDVAEWLAERPNGSPVPLFGTVQFSGWNAYRVWNSTTAVSYASQTKYADEMTENGAFYAPPCATSSNIIMYPNHITSSGFQNNFCRTL